MIQNGRHRIRATSNSISTATSNSGYPLLYFSISLFESLFKCSLDLSTHHSLLLPFIALLFLVFHRFRYLQSRFPCTHPCFPLIPMLTGGRRWNFIRSLFLWKYFAEYFPIKLVKTVDLSPEKNYIFGCHPHGVLCFSHFINFCTEATGFGKLFPKLTSHLITLNYQFYLPIHRETFGFTG